MIIKIHFSIKKSLSLIKYAFYIFDKYEKWKMLSFEFKENKNVKNEAF